MERLKLKKGLHESPIHNLCFMMSKAGLEAKETVIVY